MNYTESQKELLLDKLFVGVICFNIYNDITIIHKYMILNVHNYNLVSKYFSRHKKFFLSMEQIGLYFQDNEHPYYEEIRDLTQTILKDLIKQNQLNIDNIIDKIK